MQYVRIGLAVPGWLYNEFKSAILERASSPDWQSRKVVALVVLWSYHFGMGSVVKRSVSLPSALFEALESQATAEGRTVSAALTDAADLWLSTRRGLKAVRAWERHHGALTASELAEADRILDSAGVGRS